MEPAIFNARQGAEIVIARVQVDNLQRYRKQVQRKVRNGRIRPAAKATLAQQQIRLKVSDEDAKKILEEVLKPHREKAKHVAAYVAALKEEKEFAYPLDSEAIEELEELKRLLNLRDEDVAKADIDILGYRLHEQQDQPPNSLDSLDKASPIPLSPSDAPDSLANSAKFSFKTVRVNEQGKVIETIPGEAEYTTKDLGNGITLDIVRIPGGTFMMGAAKGEEGASKDEYPQHKVTVPEFWMGKFAVTQAQWAAVATLKKVERDLDPDPANFKGAKRPVEQVSWQDAVEFCKRLSKKAGREYRLPSEAEWEYACRAGTTTPFHFGPTITTDLANYQGTDWKSSSGKVYPGNYGKGPKGQHRKETIDVCSFPPNAFGLYDMHGNVWELCLDNWHNPYEGAPRNGSAWGEQAENSHLLRGGSWVNTPANCRAADRSLDLFVFLDSYIGFRVVSVAPRTL